MNGFTTHPQPERNSEGGGMTDAVLPQTVFPPAVTMIGTDQECGAEKSTHQGSELMIHPRQAGLLTPGALHRATEIATEGTTG